MEARNDELVTLARRQAKSSDAVQQGALQARSDRSDSTVLVACADFWFGEEAVS